MRLEDFDWSVGSGNWRTSDHIPDGALEEVRRRSLLWRCMLDYPCFTFLSMLTGRLGPKQLNLSIKGTVQRGLSRVTSTKFHFKVIQNNH